MTNLFRSAAIERMKARSSDDALHRAKLLGKLKAQYIAPPNEEELRAELELIRTHLTSGFHDEAYAIAVSGKSGAGKSTLVRETFESMEAFAPFEDEYGNTMNIYLRVRTPPDCSMKTLGRRILKAAGYPLSPGKQKTEQDIWDDVASILRRKNCHILVFDEFQHAVKAVQNKGVAHITDTVKGLTQEDNWPLYLVVVGVPQMLDFIDLDEDRQTRRRVRTIHLKDVADSEETVMETAQTLALLTGSCNLRVAFPVRKSFLRRLMHGGLWRHGLIIQLMKMSIECALMDPKCNGAMDLTHFAKGYQKLSDCDEDSNVFTATDWADIEREVDEEGKLTSSYSKKKRGAAA